MKRRVIIASIALLLTLISIPIFPFLDYRLRNVLLIIDILVIALSFIYLFFGLPKLIIYFIYGAFTTMMLLIFDIEYQLPFVVIGTLLCVLNPLAKIEQHLEKILKKEEVLPIRFSLHGSFWPYYEYRKEMKDYYHLPQARKLYTKKIYSATRQLLTIITFTVGIFLFINHLSNIGNYLDDFNFQNFFIFYQIIVVFLLTYMLYHKGFITTIRTLAISLFPTLIYLTIISGIVDAFMYGLVGSLILIGALYCILEIVNFYKRVIYEAYEYFDVDLNQYVYANALFESLVYNESYTFVTKYQIKVKPDTFKKHFYDILVYANFHRILITAYTYSKDMVYLHADFHYKKRKRITIFQTFLESKFKLSIPVVINEDTKKLIYEKEFFHKTPYIVARALYLSNLLKELRIDAKIILSVIAYFTDIDNMRDFSEVYPIKLLPELSDKEALTGRIDIKCHNVEFVIEEKITDLLLSLMSYQGQYVRISVYYENEQHT